MEGREGCQAVRYHPEAMIRASEILIAAVMLMPNLARPEQAERFDYWQPQRALDFGMQGFDRWDLTREVLKAFN